MPHREKIIVAITSQPGGIMIARNENKQILKAALPSKRAKALSRFFGMRFFVLGNT
jgi:hypothetical protein